MGISVLSRVKLLCMMLGTLLAALSARAQTPEINPKVVLQTLPYGGVEIAAWTPDDRYIVTASDASRTVLIWDAATGYVIDRIGLPGGESQTSISSKRLTGMSVAPDGNSVSIQETRYNAAAGKFDSAVFTGNRRFSYNIDLATRAVRVSAVGGGLSRTTATGSDLIDVQANMEADARDRVGRARDARNALEAQVEGAGSGEVQQASILPPLPASHDGKRSLHRTRDGMLIREEGQEDVPLKLERNLRIRDAALSPDGVLLAMLPEPVVVEGEQAKPGSTVEIFDFTTGQYYYPVSLPGDYREVEWVADRQLFATGGTARGALIDAVEAKVVQWVEPHCHLKARPDGSFYGAGLANCSDGGDFAIRRFDPDINKWLALADLGLEAGTRIGEMVMSPTGATLAALTVSAAGQYRFIILDAQSGAIRKSRDYAGEGAVSKILLLNDDTLFVSADGGNATWFIKEDDWQPAPLQSSQTRFVEADDFVVVAAGLGDDRIDIVDVDSGERLPGLTFGRVVAGGFVPDTTVFWALSAHEGLRMWDTADANWQILLTTYFFPDQGFVSVTPQGRYDTNLGPDTGMFRWLVPDRPFQSLAPQTFMRDYFTPGLTQAMMNCSAQQDCGVAFKELAPIAELNRILPEVEIVGIEQGNVPNFIRVTVAAREGEDKSAPAGKTRSGLYNLRLFRDFRFADQYPNDQDLEPQEELLDWRNANKLVDDDDKPDDGIYHKTFDIFLPTAADKAEPFFTAYAFNEDRVKSETVAYADYVRPPMPPKKPRAFVVTIGIDAYDEKRLALDYAAADARLLGKRLSKIPGYEMRNLVVAAEPANKVRPTADIVNLIFAMLAGFDRKSGLELLAAAGIDGSIIEASEPDDIVIISFSGHGWADKYRNFYLVPSDGVWPEGEQEPHDRSLVNMAEMTMWLRLINAAEIVLIIDACHAGASVESGSFKPGPMGDAGLGQLAYDKGIKILVATQADDVALESARLKQGLLTYALAGQGEGLSSADGVLDNRSDGKISLDEWIFYPVLRLPELNDDRRVTGGAGDMAESSFRFPGRTVPPSQKVQQPTLFDYGGDSKVMLGKARK